MSCTYFFYSVLVKNEWICTSFSSYAFMACVGALYHISFLYNNRLDTVGRLRFQLCVGPCNSC